MNATHLLFPLFLSGFFSTSKSSNAQSYQQQAAAQQLCFVENKGQVIDQNGQHRKDIDFRAGNSSLSMFVGSGQIHYQWSATNPANEQKTDLYRMDIALIGANSNAVVITEQKQAYKEQYYLPSLGEHGATAYAFQKITYKEIYPNIDWVLYVKNNTVEYDFVVHSGGKVSDIKLQYGGAKQLLINSTGSLTATTPMGSVIENTPKSFQEDGKVIASSFVLENNVLGFKTAPHSGTLIIDPTLSWSTYYGSSGNETIKAGCITGDNNNNRYFCGQTTGTSNIATTGSYQSTLAASTDAFIVKFNSSGVRQWATYYGGNSSDFALGTTCDPSGNVYLTGYTSSTGMSTTGSHQPTSGGGQDAYLVKFDTAGSRLWATYYGGTGSDQAYSVTTDANGNVLLAGITSSAAGIATTGSFKTTNSGGTDAFLAKFNSSGVRQWATYYGGTDLEQTQSVTSDDSNNVYIAGYTMSTTGIATTGSYQSALAGGEDGFLVKFDSTGSRQWATYCGGTASDEPNSAKCDGAGNVYICGTTLSASGISTTGSFQPVYAGGAGGDAFLMRFSKIGNRDWGTYYGGSANESATNLSANSLGNLYVTGSSTSTSGIATTGTFQDTLGGVQDAFLVKFDTSGNRIWATYFGGELSDVGLGVYCNNYSRVFIAGYTKSYTGIATSGSHQAAFAGGTYDGFIADFNDCVLTAPSAITGNDTICRNATYTYSVPTITGAVSYTWTIPSGWSGTSTGNSITLTSGSNSDTIKVSVNFMCGSSAAISKVITISALPILTPTGTISICNGDSATLSTSIGTGYVWLESGLPIVSATTNSYKAYSSNLYAVVLTNSFGCADTSATDTVVAHPVPVPTITATGMLLTTGSFVSYQWNHNGTPIVGAVANTYTISIASGNYSVTVTDSNGCSGTSNAFDATPLSIQDANRNNKVNIYPNPASDFVNIELSQKVNVSISSMDGRSLGYFTNTNRIDIRNYSSGIYLLRITDRSGALIGTEKISIQANR